MRTQASNGNFGQVHDHHHRSARKTLDEIEPLVLEEVEKSKAAAPSDGEVERARTALLAGLLRGLERVGGFGGKSDLLANYQTFLGDSKFLEKDFARYYAVTPATVQAAARRWLHDGRAVMRVDEKVVG